MGIAMPARHGLRLSGFDYSSNNWYFVTICVQDRKTIFGDVEGDCTSLSPYGLLAKEQWLMLPDKFSMIDLDEYVIMPNHIHGIIGIRATVKVAPTLGQIIGAYKSCVVHECLKLANKDGKHLGKLWQRNYYEHIVRDEPDMDRIRLYIRNNPLSP